MMTLRAISALCALLGGALALQPPQGSAITYGGGCPPMNYYDLPPLAELNAGAVERLQLSLAQTLLPWLEATVGSVLVVTYGGETVFEEELGYTNTTEAAPALANTPFQTGQISMLFTAVLAFRLRDAGVWTLDETVEGLDGPAVSLLSLLSHTSGLPGGLPLNLNASEVDTADVIALVNALPRNADPWVQAAQNPLAYALLGNLAAEALGTTFAEALDAWVIGPLGLGDTGVYDSETSFPHGCASGYAYGGGETPWTDLGWASPAGGVYSTAADLTVLLRALNGGMPEALPLATARAVSQASHIFPDASSFLSHSSTGQSLSGVLALFDMGFTAGFGASVARVPALDLTFVYVSNLGSGAITGYGTLAVTTLEQLVPQFQQLLAQSQMDSLTPPPEGPDAYVGTWYSEEWQTSIEVANLTSGALVFSSSGGDWYLADYLSTSVFEVRVQTSYPATTCATVWQVAEENTQLVFNLTAETLVWPQMQAFVELHKVP